MTWRMTSGLWVHLWIVGLLLPGSLEINVTGGVRKIEVPVPPALEAPPGTEIKRLQYSVDPMGGLTIHYTLEAPVAWIGELRLREVRNQRGQDPYLGLRVVSVQNSSPAEKAGLKRGDVIVALGGEAMSSVQRFRHLVRRHDVAQPIPLELRRGEQTFHLDVRAERRKREIFDLESFRLVVLHERRHIGVTVGEIDRRVQRYLTGELAEGVILVSIDPGSPAFYSDLRAGDIIQSLNGRPVERGEDLIAAIDRAAEDRTPLKLTARRGGDNVHAELWTKRNLMRDVSFHFPFVMHFEKSPRHTSVSLLTFGILFNYDRTARVYKTGNHYETREVGFLLDLFRYRSTPTEKSVRLLWLIGWSW